MKTLDSIINHVVKTYEEDNWATGNNDGYEVTNAIDDVKSLFLELVDTSKDRVLIGNNTRKIVLNEDRLREAINKL